MRLTAYIIFILSGAAGLIYESIWARYLGLFVGHTAYSQVLVLTMFLGGMSIGAMIIGERSRKLRDPLRGYAFAELALAVIALVFHGLYLWVTGFAYDTIFPALAASSPKSQPTTSGCGLSARPSCTPAWRTGTR